MTDQLKPPTEEEAEAQLRDQIKLMAPLVNPIEAISREAARERGRILDLIRAKHGRDFENIIRETLGLPRAY